MRLSRRSLILAAPALLIARPAEARSFPDYLETFRAPASAAGVSGATFDRAMAGLTPSQRVIDLSQRQPEFRRTIGDYVDVRTSNKRVANGRAAFSEHRAVFSAVEARFGVPGDVICSIWGNETSYGSFKGDHYVIQATATLAHAGRRVDFFRRETVAALRILQAGDIGRDAMLGSWAGAMGYVQFMPTSFLTFAADYDGDGRRNIWTNVGDAMASAANYLRRNGWTPGVPWGLEVTAPGLAGNRGARKPISQWISEGARPVEGSRAGGRDAMASLWKPGGEGGPHLLVTSNFNVIKRYNNADSYALAVGHLADRIRGQNRFTRPWPPGEGGLVHSEREEIQRRLNALGFDLGDPDGIIGDKSKAAIRQMQARWGMEPTGEANRQVLERLRRG